MKLTARIMSVLILVSGIVGSVYLPFSLSDDERYRAFILSLGSFTAGFLIFFLVTGIVYFLLRRFEKLLDSDVSMPVLLPIPIPTRERSLLMRVVVWMHQVRSWKVAEN